MRGIKTGLMLTFVNHVIPSIFAVRIRAAFFQVPRLLALLAPLLLSFPRRRFLSLLRLREQRETLAAARSDIFPAGLSGTSLPDRPNSQGSSIAYSCARSHRDNATFLHKLRKPPQREQFPEPITGDGEVIVKPHRLA